VISLCTDVAQKILFQYIISVLAQMLSPQSTFVSQAENVSRYGILVSLLVVNFLQSSNSFSCLCHIDDEEREKLAREMSKDWSSGNNE